LPHKKSTVKRLRQNKKLNERNRSIKSAMATAVKRAKDAPAEEREAAFRRAVSTIDKAAKSGVIKKETASRKKSKLAKDLAREA
jgi:small subunit ribosomal protein S20